MDFKYQIEEQGKVAVISIEGNLIEQNQGVKLLEEVEQLIKKNTNRFVLNMNGFRFMNSTGLNVLISILTKTRRAGGDTVICCVPEKVRELLVITKLINVFVVTDTVPNAVQKLN